MISFTIWISGVSASGKTTLGEMLCNKLHELGYVNTIFLDGDILRKRLPNQYGHSITDRYKILDEYIKIINKEIEKGKLVIVSTISHKKDMREIARKKINKYFEVILSCSTDVCANRDYKNQYKKAFAGKYDCFPGVTEPYEYTEKPELIIDTQNNDIEHSFNILFNNIKSHLK